jgi:uncharacterized Tic20 family protein
MESKAINSEERIWAALAHGSVFLFFFGPIVPIVVWFSQRKKSAYASFHALQAMAYQILFFWVWMIGAPFLMICFFVGAIPFMALADGRSGNPDLIGPLFPFVIWGLIFILFGLYVVVGLIAAAFSLTGREFRYPLLGTWIANHVGYSRSVDSMLDEEREDHFVAAIGHSTSVLMLWGVIVPLMVWVTQKDRSRFLSFQSLQAMVYQGLGTLAYFLGMAVYMIFIFGIMAASLFVGSSSSQMTPIVGLLFFIPLTCFGFVFFILWPLYQLLAFIASIKVLRGRDYQYPFLGKFISRRMERNQSMQAEKIQ